MALLVCCALVGAQEPPLGESSEPSAPLPTFEPPETAAPATNPIPPQEEEKAEPGYLGLVADDRGEQGQGVRVIEIIAESPAAAAGLQRGDLIYVIFGADGRQNNVRTLEDFSAVVEHALPGEKLTFGVLRNQEPSNVEVTLTRRPPPQERPFQEFGRITPQPGAVGLTPSGVKPLLGVRTEPLTDNARRSLGLAIGSGALVRTVIPNTPAARAGIPADALIVAVNGHAVSNPDDLTREVAAAGAGSRVIVSFVYGNQTHSREVVLDGGEPLASARTWRSNEGEAGAEPPITQPAVAEPPTAQPPVAESAPAVGGDRIAQLEQRIEQLERLLRQLSDQQQRLLQQLGQPSP